MILLQETSNAVTAGWQLFDNLSIKFFIRFAVDLTSVFVLLRFIYYPSYKTREMFFTFFIFNLIIFLVMFMISRVDISTGAGFGLFAIFGIMRYRTENISTKDMTYLFLSIAMGMITAIAKGGMGELILINAIILIVTWLLESNILMQKELGKEILYENIEMIRPENQQKLLNDLRTRTGLDVHRYRITKIDFLRDMAIIRIYYYDNKTNKDISV
jgi:hypothetical protein